MSNTIAIFGATGATGRELLKVCSGKGYAVNAMARKRGQLNNFEGITEFIGNFSDPTVIADCLKDVDGIIMAIGPRPPYTEVFCADATKVVIEQAEKLGVKRLMCITGALIGDYPKNQGKIFKLIGKRYEKKMPESAADRISQEERIKNSSLNWTIIKPPRLTNGTKKGHYKCAPDLKCGLLSKISRKDLAECIVDVMISNKHLNSAVFVKS